MQHAKYQAFAVGPHALATARRRRAQADGTGILTGDCYSLRRHGSEPGVSFAALSIGN